MTKWLSATAVATLLAVTPLAQAQELKIGVVNSDRILRDSQPARAAMQKLEGEFSKRDKESAGDGRAAQDVGRTVREGRPGHVRD